MNNYFCKHKSQLTIGNTTITKLITKGCPQGSSCSPGLWTILYDDLLKQSLPNDSIILAYADDAVLLTKANTVCNLENITNKALDIIYQWGYENKLEFNPYKTAAILITRKRKVNVPSIKMNNESVKLVENIRYLGIILDRTMSFKPHLHMLATKASQFLSSLAIATRNTWGLNLDVLHLIYHGAFEPLILYCVSAFQHILNKKWVQKKLMQIQRGFILRIIRSYRTISTDAALVIAGIAPLYLTATVKAELYQSKKNGTLSRDTIHFEVEKKAHFLAVGSPWNHINFVFQTTCISRHDVDIYTDGSRIPKEEGPDLVGCAFVVYCNNLEIHSQQYKLAPVCSVFQAELYAIKQAVKWSIANDMCVCIKSDSQAAIQSINDKYNLNAISIGVRNMLYNYTKHMLNCKTRSR